MTVFNLLILTILSVFVCSSSSLNILGLFPHPGKSHFIVFEPLLQSLASRGHNLTTISPFSLNTSVNGYKNINIKDDINSMNNYFNMSNLQPSKLKPILGPFVLASIAKEVCMTLRLKPVQELLKTDSKFDLIITEFFNTDCYLGFVHKYKVPFVGLSSCTIRPQTNKILGNPVNPSYIPNTYMPLSDKMSFIQSVQNTISYVYSEVMYTLLVDGPSNEEAKKHFGEDMPPLSEIANNISLMLVNSHFSLNLPRPFVPNLIEVGGMFISKTKKLPQDIEKFISEAEDGVIYFSMGSMIKGHTFPEDKRKAFLNVFSKLKQKVLWKWENDSMPGQPANVMTRKWMPQSDILCHPNVLIFVSHGGLLGTSEAVHCGVPMVMMPQYGDQFPNSKAVELNGGGVILDFSQGNLEEVILNGINAVLEESFRARVKQLSSIYRDRPLPPLETAIYWVEYVARHGGAAHMRSAAVGMPLYQYLLLDVAAFLIITSLSVIVLMYLIVKKLFQLICGGRKKEKVKHN